MISDSVTAIEMVWCHGHTMAFGCDTMTWCPGHTVFSDCDPTGLVPLAKISDCKSWINLATVC